MAVHYSKFFDPRSVKTAARRGQPNPWQKIKPWIWLSGLCLLAAGTWMIYQPVIRQHQILSARKAELQRKIDREKSQGRQLEDELLLLQRDSSYIERMARDILKYGRPGEVIFKFPEDLSKSENTPAPPDR